MRAAINNLKSIKQEWKDRITRSEVLDALDSTAWQTSVQVLKTIGDKRIKNGISFEDAKSNFFRTHHARVFNLLIRLELSQKIESRRDTYIRNLSDYLLCPHENIKIHSPFVEIHDRKEGMGTGRIREYRIKDNISGGKRISAKSPFPIPLKI